MKWRVMVELIGSDGTIHAHEVNSGGSNTAECSAETVGLTLADGKLTLAGLQDHLVQAQTQEYCRQRRLCSHCGSQRPLKDVRARRLLSVFGTVEVRAPRFLPCRCAVTRRHTQLVAGFRRQPNSAVSRPVLGFPPTSANRVRSSFLEDPNGRNLTLAGDSDAIGARGV
jgi:hypothetical protein